MTIMAYTFAVEDPDGETWDGFEERDLEALLGRNRATPFEVLIDAISCCYGPPKRLLRSKWKAQFATKGMLGCLIGNSEGSWNCIICVDDRLLNDTEIFRFVDWASNRFIEKVEDATKRRKMPEEGLFCPFELLLNTKADPESTLL